MAKINTGVSASIDPADEPDIDFSDYERVPDSRWEWGMSLTETIDFPEVIATDELCEDSRTTTGSFDVSEFSLSSFGKLLRVIPTPILLIDPFCSVVFANESCAKLGADIGPIEGRSLLGFVVRETHTLKVCETVSEVFDSRKPQFVEALLRTSNKTMWARMHFQVARLREEKVVLVLIEDLTAEKKLEIISRRQEERLLRARDTLRQVRDQLGRRAPHSGVGRSA
jgi:hypothetical protein